MSSGVHLTVHGHFYQPPRENPWTEEVPVEPSAAPFHDWNERISAESYRPNGFAWIVDDHGLVVGIVNNYALLSFNVGPTLATWLERHDAGTYARILAADAEAETAIVQAYHHSILPLAAPRDLVTKIRWGLADFEHRFGRRAEGMWLPETAVDDTVLAALIDEGVAFTILGAHQAASPIVPGRPGSWEHPDGSGRSITLCFFDGPLSHDVAFGLASRSAEVLVQRAEAAVPDGGVALVATDGETFGHHQPFTERAVAYALAVEAPRRGITTGSLGRWLRANPPDDTLTIHESAWSCAHGVGRWREDCGCSTGGRPGSNQAWRAPLRAALDVVRERAAEVFERRGAGVFHDPWAARDAYVRVLLGEIDPFAFVDEQGREGADPVEALTLLELQRQSLLMYTSCGWFFHDVAGIETVQILRYAARAIDLIGELGDEAPTERFLSVLDGAVSNEPREGSGRQIWAAHVVPGRVGPQRVAAHLALLELLEGAAPQPTVGGFDVEVDRHEYAERGAAAVCAGRVRLVHRRTRRTTTYVYGAVHLGGLDVVGGCRAAAGTAYDDGVIDGLLAAWRAGDRLTGILRRIVDELGPDEFGLAAALPGAEARILERTARALTDRFASELDRLLDDHRRSLAALAEAGYPLPDELRVPVELTLARGLRDDLLSMAEGANGLALQGVAQAIAEAEELGADLALPSLAPSGRLALERLVAAAVDDGDEPAAADAARLLALLRVIGLVVAVDAAQEVVYDALVDGRGSPSLLALGRELGLAVDHLGVPT